MATILSYREFELVFFYGERKKETSFSLDNYKFARNMQKLSWIMSEILCVAYSSYMFFMI